MVCIGRSEIALFYGGIRMDKKDLRHLNKNELVDIVCSLVEENEENLQNVPDIQQVRQIRGRIKNMERMKQIFRRVIAAIVIAAAAAVLLSTFFMPVIQVSGSSMEPALSDGDIILLMKSSSYSQSQLCCISWQNKLLLKRVIGLPGDVIDIDKEGSVYVNGTLLDEPYVTGKSLGECDINFPCVVPENKLFVMGDRRDISIDSRSSAIGCVDKDQVVGSVLFKIWSDK